jgi:hypothetical protein
MKFLVGTGIRACPFLFLGPDFQFESRQRNFGWQIHFFGGAEEVYRARVACPNRKFQFRTDSDKSGSG